jgi:hypothetical protein
MNKKIKKRKKKEKLKTLLIPQNHIHIFNTGFNVHARQKKYFRFYCVVALPLGNGEHDQLALNMYRA